MTTTPTHAPPIDGLEQATLERAANALIGTTHARPGETVYSSAMNTDQVWIVVDGWATASYHGLSVDSVGPGQIIGDLSSLDIVDHAQTVTARTDMTLLRFDRNRFCELVTHSPHLSLTIARMYAKKLQIAKTNLYPPVEIW